MVGFSSNVLVDDSIKNTKSSGFWDPEIVLFDPSYQQTESILSALSFNVSRTPKDLLAHWRRIYFCYQQALSEPLYAALLDLLIILDNKGRLLSQRLLQGSSSRLDSHQYSMLTKATANLLTVKGNRYSLFTKGLVGNPELLVVTQRQQAQHDYLALAEDFIEYSQIEEAMTILELGLADNPARQDLQAVLLEIYKSTNNNQRFKTQFELIKRSGAPLHDEWQELADFFEGKTS